MGNKKREKGRARKAKSRELAATQHVSLNAGALAQHAMVGSQEWRIWAIVGLTQGCNHGCPVLPDPNHAVSYLIDDVWAHAAVQQRYIYTFDNYRQVWDISANRKLALDIMVAAGTNIILSIDNRAKVAAEYLAVTIAVLDQYNGNGKDDFHLAMWKTNLVAEDLRCGGQREIIRFFLKRISCTCLKAKYSLVKKSQPTRISKCSTCKQVKVRSSMMLCERYKVIQYCCEECQAADWPTHKVLCRSIHKQVMK
jgi:hypothetical protein